MPFTPPRAIDGLLRIAAIAWVAALAAAPARAADPLSETFPPEDSKPAPAPAAAKVDWSAVRGVNYIPSYAGSSREMWTAYDPAAIRRELAAAAKLGFNAVRVFLNFAAYEEAPTKFLGDFEDFASAAREEELFLLPVFFDSMGVDPSTNTEARETVSQAYARFISRRDAYSMEPRYERFVKFLVEQATPDREIPSSNDPSVVFWGDWAPTPGHERMEKRSWKYYIEYMMALADGHKDDPAILAWDVMNHPGTERIFSPPRGAGEGFEFARAMLRGLRDASPPAQPLTIGAANGFEGTRVWRLYVDLLSLELFQKTGPEFRLSISLARQEAKEKPVVVSACGAVLFPTVPSEISDSGQEQMLRTTLAALEREKAGFFVWHLIEGKGPTPWAALLKPDASPKPAAEWLQGYLRSLAPARVKP